MKVCEDKKCNGCFACYNICPKKAITMEKDKFGHVYPKIDKDKCISCNLCRKICPSLNEKTLNFNFPKKCYAAYSKNKDIHLTSSSGGLAYEMCKHVIEKKGIIYGVSSYLDKDNQISFVRIDKEDDLHKIQGSKYVHAYIKNNYTHIQEDLKNNLLVLFIGTPCQIAGLKSFLRKEYSNLITIDIICHGTPSQKMLFESIKKKNINYINFRGENGFTLICKNKDNKIIYKKNKYESDYFFSFLEGWTYRENCYSCKYAQPKRISDITIGDFWGNEKYKNKNGLSLVLINSDKGETFFNELNSINKFEENIQQAIKGNAQLNNPTKKSKEVDFFKKNYKGNFNKTIYKTTGIKYLLIKIKGKLKKIKDLVINNG